VTTTWDGYAELARQLDAERAAEAARTEGLRAGVAEMSTHADDLEERLTRQQPALGQLAAALRVRVRKGAFAPLEPAEGFDDDPATALRDIAQDIDEADRLAYEAERRGKEPGLLPRWPEMLRSWLVYGVAALCALGLQVLIFYRASSPGAAQTSVTKGAKVASGATATPNPNAFVVLIVVPLICFAIAYVVASLGFRPRIQQGKVPLHARLGLLLCFGIGPFAFVLLVIHHALSR
jgi:hypothetical protein